MGAARIASAVALVRRGDVAAVTPVTSPRGHSWLVTEPSSRYTQPLPGSAPETVAAWIDSTARSRGRGMAFCAPLTPGETDRARAFVADAYHRDDFTASRRRLNVSEELITLHSTPQGDIVGIYIEGDDPVKGNEGFAASQEPFDLWFKEQLTMIFPASIDFSKPVEGIEEIFDSTRVADLGLSKAA